SSDRTGSFHSSGSVVGVPDARSKNPEYGILGTGHHSVVNAPGTDDWYIVYHRFALNGPGMPGGDGTHRETTIDRLRFAADGTILPVVPTLGSVSPVPTTRTN
ncbi:family 43 glycosylhydrolase, partial [Streptomyces prunicolor]|uniref:family 43 glycosylhydrolase n=1 Tax=Streptomyces prunicolor TaxID=67348 RepID=UPI0033E0DD04